MLKSLYIKNAAIISSQTVEFFAGLNVLSGETGAGKSVILDALDFVLGGKADKSLVRYGESEMVVEAVFETVRGTAERLQSAGYIEDGLTVISRRLTDSGRGEIRVNGRTVTSGMLRELTGGLIDVYGQSEHVSLLRQGTHLGFIDSLGAAEIDPVKAELSALYSAFGDLKRELKEFGGDESERARLLDLYDFQEREIREADLKEGEEEKLAEECRRARVGEKVASALKDAGMRLRGEYGAIGALSDAVSGAGRVLDNCDELAPLYERLHAAKYELTDICEGLLSIADDYHIDSAVADAAFDRLEEIKKLKKKYGNGYSEICRYYDEIVAESEKLRNADEQIAKIKRSIKQNLDAAYALALKLSEIRKKVAVGFINAVTGELKLLSMPGAKLEAEFSPLPSREELESVAFSGGLDKVEFLFSANSGEPVKPLVKVISGGEMSRFMLAVKAVSAGAGGIDTLVFDEIDAGISGKTAAVVAEKMAGIAAERQVICITHSPAIAAMGDVNMLIRKTDTDGKTVSSVTALDNDGKIREVMRLTGGVSGSDNAHAVAAELVTWADSVKKG